MLKAPVVGEVGTDLCPKCGSKAISLDEPGIWYCVNCGCRVYDEPLGKPGREIMELPLFSTGCKHHIECTSCPFADCIVDKELTLKRRRFREVKELWSRGLTYRQISRITGVSIKAISDWVRE